MSSLKLFAGVRSAWPGLDRPALLALLVILVAAAWRHLGALQAPFFADDYLFLEQVRGLSLPEALAAPDPLGNYFRPGGRQIHFWLFSNMFGEDPVAFHATNLGLFLASIGLTFALAHRLFGSVAAVVAAAVVALHHGFDVVILWAAGSQDLWALTAGLAAIWLFLKKRPWPSACALAMALIGKESACVVPLISIAVAVASRVAWRDAVIRAIPQLFVAAAWAAAWMATSASRSDSASLFEIAPAHVLASVWHLLHAGLGIESMKLGALLTNPLALGPLVIAIGALVWTVWMHRTPQAGTSARKTHLPHHSRWWIGPVWALLAALPVAAVALEWSAYHYAIAIVGVALTIAGIVVRHAPWVSVVAVALVLLSSEATRLADTFSLGERAWSATSHVNRAYLQRGMHRVEQYLGDLRTSHSTLPPQSTLFFANLPPSTGWQVGDGAVLRWAYGDASLRSHYLSGFSSARAQRGPVYFFVVEDGRLVDRTQDPMLLKSFAYSMIVAVNAQAADDALDLQIRNQPNDRQSRYWRVWTRIATGDSLGTAKQLADLGVRPTFGPASQLTRVDQALAVHDSAGALRHLEQARAQHGWSPAVHVRLAALYLATPQRRVEGVVEAFAAVVLDPTRAAAWRTLAAGQLEEQQYEHAAASLRRYLSFEGDSIERDEEAQQVLASLERILPGGDLSQEGLERDHAR